MTTDEAFSGLVNNKYLWQRTGESEGLRRWYRHRLMHQQPILIDSKIRLLTLAQFNQIPASWSVPSR